MICKIWAQSSEICVGLTPYGTLITFWLDEFFAVSDSKRSCCNSKIQLRQFNAIFSIFILCDFLKYYILFIKANIFQGQRYAFKTPFCEGVKINQNPVNVVNGCPLMYILQCPNSIINFFILYTRGKNLFNHTSSCLLHKHPR